MARAEKKARQGRLKLVFLDECGLMLQPTCRRTWAPAGQTPVQKVWDRHDRLSGIGVVSLTPIRPRLTFHFQLLPHNVTTEDLVWFLTALHRHVRRKVILIWDRWNVHRSAARYFEQHHPDWFQFELLPGYAPELNPVEPCWNHAKHTDLANFIPEDVDDLSQAASDSFEALHQNERILRSAFDYCKLAL